MVEYTLNFDSVFQALADETRRDILRRLMAGEKTITEIAEKYTMSFAAIAKHLNVLENARLIVKKRQGRSQIITADPKAIAETAMYLKKYEALWAERAETLEKLLQESA